MADDSMKDMPGMDSMKDMPGMEAEGRGMDTPAPPVQTPGRMLMGESMTNMPMAKPKRVWTVTGTEDWAMLRGFGPAAGMVAMMNSMMVGGSPMQSMMQNMKMGKMDASMAETPAPTPEQARLASGKEASDKAEAAPGVKVSAATAGTPVVGDNALDIIVTDLSGRPVTGLKLAATVAMVTMDMGTAHPQVVEVGGGKYRATANFSMAGPWRVMVVGNGGEVKATFDFQAGGPASPPAPADATPQAQPPAPAPAGLMAVAAALTPNPPPVGSPSTLTVTVTDAAGKPVTGAEIVSRVAMTSMNMGTSHPAFQDIGGGRYVSRIVFAMPGTWRVTLKVTPPGVKTAVTKTLDYTAGR